MGYEIKLVEYNISTNIRHLEISDDIVWAAHIQQGKGAEVKDKEPLR